MKKISLPKYHQLNASIRTIRDFCIKVGVDCTECPFWVEGTTITLGSHVCAFHKSNPEEWEELPKEVLDKE